MKSSPVNGLDQDPTRRPDFSETGRSDESVDALLELVKDLSLELGLERSFKISEKELLSNRFLLGTSKSAIGQESHARILDVCKRMDMPEDFLETCWENLPDANYVHFGFEENVRTCIYKVYLEFYERIQRETEIQLVPLAFV